MPSRSAGATVQEGHECAAAPQRLSPAWMTDRKLTSVRWCLATRRIVVIVSRSSSRDELGKERFDEDATKHPVSRDSVHT